MYVSRKGFVDALLRGMSRDRSRHGRAATRTLRHGKAWKTSSVSIPGLPTSPKAWGVEAPIAMGASPPAFLVPPAAARWCCFHVATALLLVSFTFKGAVLLEGAVAGPARHKAFQRQQPVETKERKGEDTAVFLGATALRVRPPLALARALDASLADAGNSSSGILHSYLPAFPGFCLSPRPHPVCL